VATKLLQRVPDGDEVGDLAGDGVDLCLGEIADRVAALRAALGEGEQPCDVVEGEPEILSVFDEPHHPNRVVRVLAVPGRESGGWSEQTAAFIEPQCLHADPAGRRDL